MVVKFRLPPHLLEGDDVLMWSNDGRRAIKSISQIGNSRVREGWGASLKSHVCSHVEVTAINTDVNFARGHRSPRSPRRIQPTASSGASCVSAAAEVVFAAVAGEIAATADT